MERLRKLPNWGQTTASAFKNTGVIFKECRNGFFTSQNVPDTIVVLMAYGGAERSSIFGITFLPSSTGMGSVMVVDFLAVFPFLVIFYFFETLKVFTL